MPLTMLAEPSRQPTPEEAYREVMDAEIDALATERASLRADIARERAENAARKTGLQGRIATLEADSRQDRGARADAERVLQAHISERKIRTSSDKERLRRAGYFIVEAPIGREDKEIDWHATIGSVESRRLNAIMVLRRLAEETRRYLSGGTGTSTIHEALISAEGFLEANAPPKKPAPTTMAPEAPQAKETAPHRTLLRKCSRCLSESFQPRSDAELLCPDCRAKEHAASVAEADQGKPHRYNREPNADGRCEDCQLPEDDPIHWRIAPPPAA